MQRDDEFRNLRKINEIAKIINSATNLDEVLGLILKYGMELLEAEYGDLWVVEKQTGDLLLKHGVPDGRIPERSSRIKRGSGIVARVVQKKAPVITTVGDAEWSQRLELLPGMKSELAYPLFFASDMTEGDTKGDVIGVINFESGKENAFSGDENDLLDALAEHAIIAIRNAKVMERQRGLGKIDRAILNESLDLKSVLSVLIKEGLKLLDTMKGQILLYDGNDTLQIVASIPDRQIDRKLSIYECISGRAVLQRETVHVRDVRRDPLYKLILGEVNEIVAEIVTPLISHGKVVGVFNLENSYEFSTSDKELLELLAGQAAIAIKTAQLLKDIKTKNEELSLREEELAAFQEIAIALTNRILSLEEVLKTILELGLNLLHGPSGQLLLMENNRLFIKVTIGEVTDASITSVALDEGICGYAARSKRPQIISDITKPETYEGHYIGIIRNTRSELAYPLLDNDQRVLGVFNVESPFLNSFNDSHVRILNAINSQIIIAIQNAELQDATRQLGEILSDINAAKSLNETLTSVLEAGLQLIKVPDGQLLEFDEPKHELVVRVTRGEYDKSKENRLPLGEGVSSWVVENKRSIIVSDVRAPNIGFNYVGYLKDMRSELAVPLLIGASGTANAKVIGVINVESPEVDYFTERHQKTLELLAKGAALAIENARKAKRVKEHNARLLHDIGNKAGPILGSATRILEDIEDASFKHSEAGESIKEDLELIRTSSNSILDLKKNFLGITERAPLQLEDILRESIRQQHIPKDILSQDIQPALPKILGDAVQLDRAITNLLKNAMEAMEGVQQKELRANLKLDASREHVILEISDTGCGIDPSHLEKVFEPHWTTKEGKGGAGLGLATVDEIIRDMGGKVVVESKPGEGSTFSVYFQVAPE